MARYGRKLPKHVAVSKMKKGSCVRRLLNDVLFLQDLYVLLKLSSRMVRDCTHAVWIDCILLSKCHYLPISLYCRFECVIPVLQSIIQYLPLKFLLSHILQNSYFNIHFNIILAHKLPSSKIQDA